MPIKESFLRVSKSRMSLLSTSIITIKASSEGTGCYASHDVWISEGNIFQFFASSTNVIKFLSLLVQKQSSEGALKKQTLTQVFSCEFREILKNTPF